MFHVVIYQPEIPPNTGNIMRLCVNTGSWLHLIEPLGFTLEDRELRRAGLDYREWVDVRTYNGLETFIQTIKPRRMLAFSTRGLRLYTEVNYMDHDALLFGPETRGLPQEILKNIPDEYRLRLPLRPDNRSLNLSNTVAIVVYEAWRQLGFQGGR
jgi:tRNA (cytidine/uridine-2'-O-)-methyltransferase